MATITQEALTLICRDHGKWLKDRKTGVKANVRGIDLSGLLFQGADLTESTWLSCNMTGCDLTKVVLRLAKLNNCNLTGAKLISADLNSCDIRGVKLTNADLTNTDLRNVLK